MNAKAYRARLTLALLFLLCSSGSVLSQDATHPEVVHRIAFGSCNKPWIEAPIWQPIVAGRPDVWIWLGDIVYAKDGNPADLHDKFVMLSNVPGYKKLLSLAKVIGVWDDHDYGKNNGGAEYGLKEQSKTALLDFLDEPPDSPRRKRPGVYTSYNFGPPGKRLKIILLDERSFRTREGRTGDMLGETQWQWLEDQLSARDAECIILGSSTQILAQEHPFETWGKFPAARKRLLDLITKTRPPKIVILSGDRHMAEISKLHLPGLDYPLVDITSSGMTHFATPKSKSFFYDFSHETNSLRVGKPLVAVNFGRLEFDWTKTPVHIRASLRDVTGQPRATFEW